MKSPFSYNSRAFNVRPPVENRLQRKLDRLGSPDKVLEWLSKNVLEGGPCHDDALEFCDYLWAAEAVPRELLAAIALKTLAASRDADVLTADELVAAIPRFREDEQLKKAYQRIRAIQRSKDSYYFDTRFQARDPERVKAQLSKNKTYKPIPHDAVFTCIGSCFAANLGAAVKGYGIADVMAFRYNDNSEPLEVLSAFIESEHFKERITGPQNPVVVMTAGFAETGSSGDERMGPASLNSFLSPEAVAKAILKVANSIQGWNPNVRFFVTVSPVPLHGTASGLSPYEANAISKSIVRLGVELARSQNAGIEYFPSYELVTQHASAIGICPFGAYDGTPWHVNEDFVSFIVGLFMEFYLPSIDLSQPPDPLAQVVVAKLGRHRQMALESEGLTG